MPDIIFPSGHRLALAPGDTVLQAAQRAGLASAPACVHGGCGSCVVGVPDEGGQVVHACQWMPLADTRIEPRAALTLDDLACRELDVVVARKWMLAPDVVGLQLRSAGDPLGLRWLAGQYLQVVLGDGQRRPFSIANAPSANGVIELHVRQTASGGFTRWVGDVLAPGDMLRIEGPLGSFVPREDSERPMVLMAGGTGFAPVKAIVEHFLALGTRRAMRVYWGARHATDLYLRGLAENWQKQAHDLRFHGVISEPEHAAGLRAGLVHEAVLVDVPDLSGHDVYMSGPPAMIEAGRELFGAAGLPLERLFHDSYGYKPERLAEALKGRVGMIDPG